MDPRQLLLLSLLLWAHSEAEVVRSVSDCAEFFLKENPPQIPGVLEKGEILDQNRYKPICQTYDDQQTFFTLYDTTNKIPVFSAYVFNGNGQNTWRPKSLWMTEPQLERNMERDNKNCKNQASPSDYINAADYTKGHLYPVSYGYSQTDINSSCTLTNIVPQAKSFNEGSWNKMESCIKCVLTKFCRNNNDRIEGFLVTGAKPGDNVLNNKINIPSMMWSAFCCYSSREKKWLASAHWGDNVPDEPKDRYMETKTLNELYSEFSRRTDFNLFHENPCPLDETVTQFYTELNNDKSCKCPPNTLSTLTEKLIGIRTPTKTQTNDYDRLDGKGGVRVTSKAYVTAARGRKLVEYPLDDPAGPPYSMGFSGLGPRGSALDGSGFESRSTEAVDGDE